MEFGPDNSVNIIPLRVRIGLNELRLQQYFILQAYQGTLQKL